MPVGFNTFVRRAGMLWRWARGENAHRLNMAFSALPADLIADTARQIMRWSLPLADTPEDALVYLLRDHGMPAYVEPYANTLSRVREFMTAIPYAGAQSMLEAQAVWAGLVNPVVVPDLPNSAFSITADNVGFQPRWGDPGYTYGDGTVYGAQVSTDIAKNIRALLSFFRPARERYTGIAPTTWAPSLFEPESYADAKHGTASGGTFSSFAEQGRIGNVGAATAAVLDTLTTEPAEEVLASGAKMATMNDTEVTHNLTANAFRGTNGIEDGFFWIVADLNSTGGVVAGTCDGNASDIGWRLSWTGASQQLILRFSNGTVFTLSGSEGSVPYGTYLIVVSVDTSQGTYGGVTTYVNGYSVVNLTANFSAYPSHQDPQSPLVVGDLPSNGSPLIGDWMGWGWVKGRPAIQPDIDLLLAYYTAEVAGSSYSFTALP